MARVVSRFYKSDAYVLLTLLYLVSSPAPLRTASGGNSSRPPHALSFAEAMTPGDGTEPRPRSRDPRKPRGSEAADLVSAVLDDAARREQARAKRPEPVGRNRQRIAAVSLPLAGAFSFYLWFGNPAWVAPTLPDPITAEKAEAGLRVAMFFEAQKIETFHSESGRLPDTMEEMGSAPPEMTYSRLDARTYRLIGQSRGVTLTFNSEEAINQVVGDAMDRLGIGQGR